MQIRKLGSQGLTASQMGLGCMGMSEFYGPHDDAGSIKTIHRALELGINFLDTADAYGPYANEELVGKAIKGRRDKFTLATKFGFVRSATDAQWRGISGKPEYVKSACEASLKRLQVDSIDLYYQHRVDPEVPIEETVGAMAALVKEGKIKAIGLSEVSINSLKRAHAVHPVSAVQSEYSLWSREPEDGMLHTCKEMGIAFVAYSPLGRGFLTGQIKKYEDLAADDWRRNAPRFQGENFEKNLLLVEKIEELAKQKNCTASQLALAWVMAQGHHIFPIPGTKRVTYLQENAAALNVKLSTADFEQINAIAPAGIASGTRYTEGGMKLVNR
ncbi:MAG: aldo/keto reductase [Chitinophagaceae bacterium]|nr:aldo/keto reductase [Chitinophagaceae bacterium]